jgi:hypothetical protein
MYTGFVSTVIDWAAIGSAAGVVIAAIALGSVAAAWGAGKQKIEDLEGQLASQAGRIDKVEEALGEAKQARQAVELTNEVVRGFKDQTQIAHQAILAEVRHVSELSTMGLDGVRNEVRAFMQGQTRQRKTSGPS